MNEKNGVKTKIDLAVLSEKMENFNVRLIKIEENHLPHIHEKLEDIEKKLAYWAGGLAVIAILTPIIIKFLWK